MKSFNWKSFISGSLVSGILFTSISVFAVPVINEAYFNGVNKLVVDGKQVNTDIVTVTLDGQVNGRNYVSARDLAEAMGATVSWIDSEKTIYVDTSDNTENTIPTPEPTSMPTPTPVLNENIPDQSKIPTEVNSMNVEKDLKSDDTRIQKIYDLAKVIKYNGVLYCRFRNLINISTSITCEAPKRNGVRYIEIIKSTQNSDTVLSSKVAEIDDLILLDNTTAEYYVKYDLVIDILNTFQ